MIKVKPAINTRLCTLFILLALAWSLPGCSSNSCEGEGCVAVTSDQSVPVITRFDLISPTPTDSAEVTFILEDTDNVGVTGWFIKEDSVKPSALDLNWLDERPSLYYLSVNPAVKTVYIWVRDQRGNVSDPKSLAVELVNIKDTIPPIIEEFLPDPDTLSQTANRTISFTISGYDNNGNITGIQINESPVKPDPAAGKWDYDNTYTLSSGFGMKAVYAWMKDSDGNVSSLSSATSFIIIYYDNEEPVVTGFDLSSASPANYGLVSFTLDGADNSGTVSAWMVNEENTPPDALDGRWSSSVPESYIVSSGTGTKTMYAWLKDPTDNVNTVTYTISMEFTDEVDNTAPVITEFSRTSSASTMDPVVRFTLSGNDNIGITGWMITENGLAPGVLASGWMMAKPAMHVLSSNGDYDLYVWAKDFRSNVSVPYTHIDVTCNSDNTAPSLNTFALTSSNPTYNPMMTFSIEGTDNSGAITGWMITESSQKPSSSAPGWIGTKPSSYTLPGVAGTYTMYAWGKDAQGNVSESISLALILQDDTVAPSIISFTLTSASPTLDPAVSFTLAATDNSGVIEKWLITEEVSVPAVDDELWTETKPSIHQLSAGYSTKTIYARAMDSFGNISVSESIEVKYGNDAGPPEVTDFYLTSNNPTADNTVSFVLAGTDDYGITDWMITETSTKPLVNDGSWSGDPDSPASYAISLGFNTHTLYAWAKDGAGYISDSKKLTVDYVGPGAEPWLWEDVLSQTGNDEAFSVAVDSYGNFYVAGYGTNLIGTTDKDWWIKKYNANGVEQSFNGSSQGTCNSSNNPCSTNGLDIAFDGNTGNDEAKAVAVYEDGGTVSVYVVGYATNLVGATSGDWWIKKFDDSGNEDTSNWNKNYDSAVATGVSGDDRANAVAIDSANGDIYVVGRGRLIYEFDWWIKKFSKNGTELDFYLAAAGNDCELYEAECSTNGLDRVFNAYNSNDEATAVVADLSGNVFVGGYGTSLISNEDWWLKKFTTNGTELDITNGVGSSCGPSVAIDPCTKSGMDIAYNGSNDNVDRISAMALDSNGNLYVAGYGYNYRNQNMWVMKFDGDGVPQNFTGGITKLCSATPGIGEACTVYGDDVSYDRTGAIDKAHAIVIDGNDRIYIGGSVDNGTYYDWWLRRFDNFGNIDSRFDDRIHSPVGNVNSYCNGIAVDNDGNVLAAGSTSGNADWWVKAINHQPWAWEVTVEGRESLDEEAYDVVVDSNGNIYVIGYGYNLIADTSYEDWWVKKYNSNGVEIEFGGSSAERCSINRVVTRDICTTNGMDVAFNQYEAGSSQRYDYPYSITVDSHNNVYVVGTAYDLIADNSEADWWIKKFNSNGVEQSFGGSSEEACNTNRVNTRFSCSTNSKDRAFNGATSGQDIAYGVAIDSDNNVYIVGSAFDLISTGSNQDWWIKKFNSSGVELNFGGSLTESCSVNRVDSRLSCSTNGKDLAFNDPLGLNGNEYATSVAVDSGTNVYVGGTVYDAVAGASAYDWWLKKFNSIGVEQDFNGNVSDFCPSDIADEPCTISGNDIVFDVNLGGSRNNDIANSIETDANNNVYVAGTAYDLIADNSEADWLIKKFNSSGVEQDFGGSSEVDCSSSRINTRSSCSTNSKDRAFHGTTTGSDSARSISIGLNNYVFVAGYSFNVSNNWWIKRFSSSGVEDITNWDSIINGFDRGDDRCNGIAVDNGGNVYTVGSVTNGTGNIEWWIKKYFDDRE